MGKESMDPLEVVPQRLLPRGDEYPEALAEAENQCLHIRRRAAHPDPGAKVVGLALSGGGIRSATFCLGVMRGLAEKALLQRVDLLSTVSGGGYAGSFLGALIQRRGMSQAVESLKEVPPALNTTPSTTRRSMEALKPFLGFPIRWLRDNGRYLAPNGSGDSLLMGATLFRNWVAMHLVLGTLFLGIMLALKVVWTLPQSAAWLRWTLHPGSHLWWSPWVAVAGAAFLLLVVPTGWGFWLVEARGEARERAWFSPVRVVAATVVGFGLLGYLGAFARLQAGPGAEALRSWMDWAALGIAAEGLLTLLWFVTLRNTQDPYGGEDQASSEGGMAPTQASQLRWSLSRHFSNGISWTFMIAALALLDSLGQSIYAIWVEGGMKSLHLWSAGFFALITTLALASRKLASFLPAKKEDVGLPTSLLAGLGALLLMGTMLVGYAALATGFAWGFKEVAWEAKSSPSTVGRILVPPAPSKSVNLTLKIEGDPSGASQVMSTEVKVLEGAKPLPPPPAPHRGMLFAGLGICAIFTFVAYGRNRAFLNLSSMSGFYQKRLTRTYLGASNESRGRGDTSPRDEMPDDDVAFERYQPWNQGGPLHWVNVTINETLDGSSHIQNQDRKGTPLAAGPAGLSVGVRHHATWIGPVRSRLRPAGAGQGHSVFGAASSDELSPQPLTLGQWMGISGAAFSTGMGFRTSLGLSLLCGFFNIRTGYWWYSGVDPRASMVGARDSWSHFSNLLPVQAHFLDEWLARFHGTARRHWYLSDGGHFENSAVYELVRRRVPTIILCDAGADEGYVFDDLANLTLKLRTDFGAELTLFEEGALRQPWNAFRESLGLAKIPDTEKPNLGAWEQLRRGAWTGKAPEETLKEPCSKGHSLCHGTLAQITYPLRPGEAGQGEGPGIERSLLLILKPALTGDEPMDVTYYHSLNPDFPHESTLDQFFDEAQWEAYRKLGEHAVASVFGSLATA